MQTILYTEARNNLHKLIKKVSKDQEPAIIVGSRGRKDTVLLSKENYDSLLENLYIQGKSEWGKSIRKGVKELDAGKGKKINIYEALRI
ncbi:MAG: type II toxin-antitoxin system prevent-host-death family antitoxin [Melioribacteraceae bacterium]